MGVGKGWVGCCVGSNDSHCSQCFICFPIFTPHKNSESSIISLIPPKRNLIPVKVKIKQKISQIYIGRKWQRQDLNLGLTGFKACVLTLGRVDSKGKSTGEEPCLLWEFQSMYMQWGFK